MIQSEIGQKYMYFFFFLNFTQLHHALNKLRSAQLIIALFNKEHTQDSMDTAISQQGRTDLEEYDKWKLVTPRCPNVKIGDKKKWRTYLSIQSNKW
jgi:hypothetical protein